MAEVKITDLVPQETIDKVNELNARIAALLEKYKETAMELAKGVDIKIRVVGDIEKFDQLLAEKTREATQTATQLNEVMAERTKVMGNTSNTIARYLMEREKVNKAEREAYTEHEKVKNLLEQYHDTYEGQAQRMAKLTLEIEKNKKAQKENEKALADGSVSMEKFTAKQASLIAQHRSLTQEKRNLSQIMTAEEKAALSSETSYAHMSQQLELLKKAYKDLDEEGRSSSFGKELESAIQNLDAHLKDFAADMGEHQRNVGNYAIACQNGAVSIESVVAAMKQEALTSQDLMDQTKILEEAKVMLNKDDANYQSTLEALNAKLEENKRKLTDVSDILGKEAKSVAEAEAQNKRLTEAMKHIDLTSADAKKRLEEMRAQIERNNKTIADATGANEQFADSVLGILGVNTKLGSSFESLGKNGNFIDGLNTKAKAFWKTLTGLLANPWVLAFLGIAGVAAGFKWWYDYNKGMIEASRLTENFTGLTGEAADKITADTQALADHMGKGYDATIGAANTLVQQFGISWDEALTRIQDGIEAGADMNGKFLENIEQFAPALRDAGVSADELVAILAETRNGVFNEKGVQDIVKGGTRLRAMTDKIAESLDACGISSKKMQKDLEDGNITMLDAVQQVAARLKELPENSQEAGMVMKNVFGRTAAEGGTLLIQSIADVNTNLDVAKERMGELGKVNHEQMEAQKELNETLAAVFKMSGTSFEVMTTKAKTYVVKGLTAIIKGCIDIANWFIRMYNKSGAFRGQVENLVFAFKEVWAAAKFLFNLIIDGFKNSGEMLEAIFDFDITAPKESWNKIEKAWMNGMKRLQKEWKSFSLETEKNYYTAIDNGKNGHMDEFDYNLKTDEQPEKPQKTLEEVLAELNKNKDKGNGNGNGNGKGNGNRSKEAEKEAKEELKRLQELEESKLAIMEDGHEKDLATIRLKFKKKLDEIKGEGETEKALRVQLAEECQHEISQCERKYQEELTKINLANHLASVKKGSKEELNLKLAQLEASRKAELEAAKKNGADVNFINAKFNKERLELEEAYAASQSDLIMKRYSHEKEADETNHILEMARLQKEYNEKLDAAKGNHSKMEKAEKDFQKKMEKLEKDYAIKQAEASIKMYENMLKTAGLSADLRLDIEEKLARARAQLEKLKNENDKPDTPDSLIPEDFIEGFEKWSQYALEVFSAVNDAMQAFYDNQIERIEEVQEANEAAGEAEQERIADLVNKKVISSEEGEARKRAAEAETARKNEALEKKKQQLKIKQAKWDKANSISQATISTALAVMNALNTKPFWLGLAMAAIAGAMGAAQIATIVATPIPAYAKGTDHHPGGPAIVGDGGRPEMVVFKGSAWITPDKPTVLDLPTGASVIPKLPDFASHSEESTMLNIASSEKPMPKPYDDTNLRHRVSELSSLVRTLIKQRRNDNYLAKYELFKSKI